MSETRAEVSFDHYDGSYAADPYPTLHALRQQCPVAHSDAHGGFWVAAGHADVWEIAHCPQLFSSRYITIPKDIGFGDVRIPPIHLDPPEHTRVKKLLASAFVPSKVTTLEKMTRDTVIGLLEPHLRQGRLDGSDDFAKLLPTAVVCQILGLPPTLERFTGWVMRILEFAATDPMQSAEAVGEIFVFLTELVASRRADPGEDILSSLVHAEIDGEKLSDEEIVLSCAALLLAGIDTTWSMLGCVLHYLATEPDAQARLRSEPALQPTAIEEFLRAFAPVTVAREVTEDTEVHGQRLRAGEMVLISFPSANRDEAAFPDGDDIDLERQPNPHLAFGTGAHKCLGSNVARMELRVALEEVLRLLPPFRLGDPADVVWSKGPVRGPRRLPLLFEVL